MQEEFNPGPTIVPGLALGLGDERSVRHTDGRYAHHGAEVERQSRATGMVPAGRVHEQDVERLVKIAGSPLQQRSFPKSQVAGKVGRARLAGEDARCQRSPILYHAGPDPAAISAGDRRRHEQASDGDRPIHRRQPDGNGDRGSGELLLERLELTTVTRPSDHHAVTIGSRAS
jgi:hypothetical protein